MTERAFEPPAPYQSLVEHLPVVVYVSNNEQPIPRTLYISPNVEQLTGYRPTAFLSLGEAWTSMLHPDDLEVIGERYAASWASGEAFELEYRFIHPEGRVVWVRDRAVPFVDPTTGGRIWQGVLEDVSDRVAAEERGDVSELRYETLLENLPAVVYEMVPDDDRRTRYVNRKIEELLGYTMEEWLEQPDMWMEVLHPDDREVELAAHDLHSATGDPWQREYRLIHAGGQIVWVRDQATLVRDPDGNPFRWQGVMVDITIEKEAQRALERSNDELEFRVRARTAQLEQANEAMGLEIAERVRAETERDRASGFLDQVMRNVPAVVYLWQVRGRDDGQSMAYVGDQIFTMLGYTPDEWNASGWRDRVHPHDRDRVVAAAERSIEFGEPYRLEYRYLARDGRVVWVVDHATLVTRDEDGDPLLFEGVMIDVTAQREAESAAATATDRLRELVEHAPAVLFGYSVEGDPPRPRVDYLSPRLGELLGMPSSSSIDGPSKWFEMIHPDDREDVIRSAERAWAIGADWDDEYRMLAASGEIVWIRDLARCVRRPGQDGSYRFVGIVMDVTQRRLEVDRLAARAERLEGVTKGFPGVLWTFVTDPSTRAGRFTFLSAGTEELTSYTAAELMGERDHLERIMHPDDLERVNAIDLESDETGVWDATYRIRRRDGQLRWLHSVGRRSSDDSSGEEVWHGVAIDVTDQMPDPNGGETSIDGYAAEAAEATPALDVTPPPT